MQKIRLRFAKLRTWLSVKEDMNRAMGVFSQIKDAMVFAFALSAVQSRISNRDSALPWDLLMTC